jgi:ABC-type spermidine/putrescine transport system permease subunit II
VEAGADLYATPWRRFRQIVLPLMMPAVLAGGLLAFSLSLDNIVISTFVSVADAAPWPVAVFGSVRDVLRPEVAAISTLMLVLTLIALVLVALVVRDRRDATEEVADPIVGVG